MHAHKHDHEHGHDPSMTEEEFLRFNKQFYLDEEEYDWVKVTDNVKGFETLFHRGRQRAMRRLLAKFGAKPYLDAGCGTGLMLRHLPPGSVGVDINPRNLPKARFNAPGKNVMQADIEHLPVRPGSLSTIVMTEVLEHFPNPADVLAALVTLLRPGGRLIGTVPSKSLIWRLRFLSSSCPAEEPFHKNYDKSDLRGLMEKEFSSVKLGVTNTSMSIYFVATR